jgi:hypothetical protein
MNLLSVISFATFKNSTSAIAAIKDLTDSVFLYVFPKIIPLVSSNKDIFIKLDKMFRNCHALVVKNRPLSDYEWMCELDETKGIILGKTYRNTESHTFLKC